MASVLVRAVY